MPKPTIAIVGQSGTGKSTSLRNLPVDETVIIDLERKGFPFRGYEKLNIKPCATKQEFDQAFNAAKVDPKVTYIVIESFTKLNEMCLELASLLSRGDGFKTYASLEAQTTALVNSIKCDKIVIVTAIDEIVKVPNVDGTENTVRRIATKGRAWEGKIEKEFLCVFFTQTVKDKQTGEISYMFQTNTDGNTSAKTPMEMFKEKLIPNDLNQALTRLKEYYNE